MSSEITFVTGNAHKFAEAQAILGDGVVLRQAALELEEIQGVELEDVARHKLVQAYAQLKRPLFCEDTGLFIAALKGFPGALVKWYLERVGIADICRLHGGSEAYGKTVVGYHDGVQMHFFSGVTHGTVARAPQGKGFGWSTLFVPHMEGEGNDQSFAEIPISLKNQISMRSKALRKMQTKLV